MPEKIIFTAVLLAMLALITAIAARARFYKKCLREKQATIDTLSQKFIQVEQQMFHDKDQLRAILSSMVEGVIVVKSDGKILYVSPNASGMLQMRSTEVEDKMFWEVIRHQEINICLKNALQDKQAVYKEVTFIGARDVFFSMQISPVIEEGKLTSVVAVFHDITEFKNLIKMRSEFVANVSHELKTPLTSIKGFVETLRAGGLEDTANARKFLGIIHQQAGRLENLVNSLLNLSAIESKETKMELAAGDIASVIRAVLLMQKKAIAVAGHEVSLDLPADLPKIIMDHNHIEQVFINLLDNAIKFTPPGGRIHIQAQIYPPFMRIDVQDSGMGIPAEHVSRIFERFYRVDKARSSALGGTGLGLSIVKHIVQAHQGKIEVQSTLGQGSTFTVFLPLIK